MLCRARSVPYQRLFPAVPLAMVPSLSTSRISALRICAPALARRIVCKQGRTRLLSTSTATYQASVVPSPRPYTFHLGASWAGKPEDPTLAPKVPFPPDTLIGSWRDKMLDRKKRAKSVDAGEDFFFIQEVRIVTICVGKACIHTTRPH